MLTGNGYIGMHYHSNDPMIDSSGMSKTSMEAGLMPIVLWRIGPRLFMESELELMSDMGMFSAELGYLNFSYYIENIGNIQVGKFLSPYGIYSERYHPYWINNAPNQPLGFAHGQYSPESETGICFRGGSKHFNYAVYVSKSPEMKNGEQKIYDAGKINYDIHLELDDKIGAGSRLGILPFRSPDVEFGFSYKIMKVQVGDEHKVDEGNHTHNTNTPHVHEATLNKTTQAMVNSFAADLSFQKNIPKIKGRIDIKAQANYSDAGKNYFIIESADGMSDISYSFQNITKMGFVILSYKPVFAINKYINKSGIYARLSAMQLPEGSLWHERSGELTVGFNYHFSWRNVLKTGYQQVWSTNNNYSLNNFLIQWAVAF